MQDCICLSDSALADRLRRDCRLCDVAAHCAFAQVTNHEQAVTLATSRAASLEQRHLTVDRTRAELAAELRELKQKYHGITQQLEEERSLLKVKDTDVENAKCLVARLRAEVGDLQELHQSDQADLAEMRRAQTAAEAAEAKARQMSGAHPSVVL